MENDGVTAVIDAVTGAIQTLLDLLSGKKTISDVLWDSLEGFFSKVGEFFGRMVISLVNALIDVINKIPTINLEHLDYDAIFGTPSAPPNNGGSREDLLEEKATYTADFGTNSTGGGGDSTGIGGGSRGTTLARGDSGDAVTELQKFLASLGYYTDQIDGLFGPETERGLALFQGESGLGMTGTLTPETQAYIDALTAAEESTTTMAESAIVIGEGLDGAALSLESAGISASRASSAGGKLVTAITALWRKLAGIRVPSNVGNGAGGGGENVPMAYAVGLDTVPYDGYRATLHRGEMVLNASEASAYRLSREAMAFGGGTEIDYDRLAYAMGHIGIDIDGRRAGRLVERGVSARQYERAVAYERANPTVG
jgi:peptidoglycan hydrolase-like protein with peptidoglycan-binding domain